MLASYAPSLVMDDRFLNDLRRDPPAGFDRALRERLRQLEDAPEPRGFRLHPAFAGALAVAAFAVAFTIPAVRVAAQNALDLFRVRSFAAVEISEQRIEQLKALANESDHDPSMMLFEKQEVLLEPGPAQDFPSADLAASAAGLPGIHRTNGAIHWLSGDRHFTLLGNIRREAARQIVDSLR